MRAPETAPLRVVLVSPDPLVKAGLQALLSDRTRIVLVPEAHDADVALVTGDAVLPAIPTLVLTDDPEAERAAVAGGARGAVSRTSDGTRLSAALRAIDEGFLVMEPGRDRDREPALPLLSETPTLTEREAQVLELAVEGLSNKEIAARLAMSAHTARFHVRALLRKLDLDSRAGLALRALRLGLIRLQPTTI
jgi:two-component system, NarL family, nitrate/nitrite response regulator NarL